VVQIELEGVKADVRIETLPDVRSYSGPRRWLR
jgi:hypothetical protein